jgi:hypothetical protein
VLERLGWQRAEDKEKPTVNLTIIPDRYCRDDETYLLVSHRHVGDTDWAVAVLEQALAKLKSGDYNAWELGTHGDTAPLKRETTVFHLSLAD